MQFNGKLFICLMMSELLFQGLIFVPVKAHAKMYKCTSSDGKIIYQTHECSTEDDTELISKKEFGVDYRSRDKKYGFDNSQTYKFRKVKKISDGEKVNLQKYAVNGVKTAFYFYAEWCGTCRKVGPEVEKKVEESDNIALRMIDLTDPDSPVRIQYHVDSVPYFIVYDEAGKEISRGNNLKF